MTARGNDCVSEAIADSIPYVAFQTRARAGANAQLRRLARGWNQLAQGFMEWIGCVIYLSRGRLPLTAGYAEYRNRFVRKTIGKTELLEVFRTDRELPVGYGARLDERVVEYPWVLSRLGQYGRELRLLDAGSTLNYKTILLHPAVRKHRVSIVTLVPEKHSFWDLGISYLYEDLRSLPCKDEWFDAITCISTLEHVGMDNVRVTQDLAYSENCPQDYLAAMREMRRVLKPGGVLLLTIPFGRYEHHKWLQQFDSKMLSALIAEFAPRKINRTFFRYTLHGWQLAEEEECSDLSFSEAIRNKHALRKGRVRGFPSDYAVAARCVACIEMEK